MRPRVISLVPSATEIVCALGRRELLVGRSHECDYPLEVEALPVCSTTRVNQGLSSAAIDRDVKSAVASGGSLYELDSGQLASLRPDIILTQAQCGVCAVSPADLEKAIASIIPPPQVVTTSPVRLADLWKDIATIADALGAAEEARELLASLKNRVVDILQKTCAMTRRRTVACLEWLDPLMAAGHWMPELVDFAGGANLFGAAGAPSPWITWTDLTEKNPDVIILMPCGFPLARARLEASSLAEHPAWRKLRAVKSKEIYLADGSSYFNRPGPRLVDSLEILAEILWPKVFAFGHKDKGWTRL